MAQLELFKTKSPGEGKTCRDCAFRERHRSHEKSNKAIQRCKGTGKKIKVTDPACWAFVQILKDSK